MEPLEITPWQLHFAYSQGIFPMANERGLVEWYVPRFRALFDLDGFHVSRSLAKAIRKGDFEIRLDTSFEQVMRACMRPTDNWINEELIRAYTAAHGEGWGHCSEVWYQGELVGGVYGLAIGGAFFAESMFHRRTNASKIALWALIQECRRQGFVLFDAQVMNPHLESLGAYEIPQAEFLVRLEESKAQKTEWGCQTPYF